MQRNVSISPVFDFNSRSIWGDLEPKTVSTVTVDIRITGFDHAIKNSHDYDDAIRQKLKEGKSGEDGPSGSAYKSHPVTQPMKSR